MKKTLLYTIAIVGCMCLFTTTSKECGKAANDKISEEAVNKKVDTGQKSQRKEEEAQTEFSLINTLFFQTT